MSRTSFNLRGKNVAMMSIIKVVIVIMMIMRRCAFLFITKINMTNDQAALKVVRDRRIIEQLCPE